MKKIFIKSICLLMVFAMCCSLLVFANDVPAKIYCGATSVVNPGEEAVMTIDVLLNTGYDIQAIQVNFNLSDNFPQLKKTHIVKNTTGWDTVGINQKNILAVGSVIENSAELSAKIVFDVPSDAKVGEEYVLTIEKAVAANTTEELPIELSDNKISVVVTSNKNDTAETPKVDENKPDDTITEDKNQHSGSTAPDKQNEDIVENEAEIVPIWKNPFDDVKADDWFYEGVRFVNEQGLMSGVETRVFAPQSTLTRAMLVTILHRLDGSPESMTFGFSDVSRKMWYTKSIDWAASYGIVNGVGNNKFEPDTAITREQIAVLLFNYTKYKKMDISQRKDLIAFRDSDKVSEWAKTSLEWAVASGLISGKNDNMLDPLGNATRAEFSVIMERYAAMGEK